MTIKDLKDKQAKGLIRGFTDTTPPKNISPKTKKGSKIKEWISIQLGYWCFANNLELQYAGCEKGELIFHPKRKWRFDWAVPSIKLAVEYEGLMSKKSRHTTISGYSGDTDKYREAALLGWTVLRYTATNYKHLAQDIEKVLAKFKTENNSD